MSTVHKNLTGADLHEPKGADTALAGQVYVSNGTGSGTWTTASSIITNTAFTTGDAKLTFKTVADSGWVLMDDGTIGDGSSGASTRANADTASLFTLLWNNVSDTWAPVNGGRGASAAADFAAHKKMSLPRQLGRALLIAGAGATLTNRVLGSYVGYETTTLVTANLPPYTPTGSVAVSSIGLRTRGGSFAGTTDDPNSVLEGKTSLTLSAPNNGPINAQPTATFTGSAQGGTSTPLSIMQPSAVWNIMVKL